jgi:HEPN domain-containing protein
MPPKLVRKGGPHDWLLHANSDLELARTGKSPGILLETLCFHAHQAVEKAIKAVLIAYRIPIIKSHNIGALIKLLPEGIQYSPELKEAISLTDYAVLSRYPGDLEPVTEKEYQDAIQLAEKVMQWAKRSIHKLNATK